MAKQNYLGVRDPKGSFEALKPYRQSLIRMKMEVRPFGPEYLLLDEAMTALDAAARHFTGDPTFYALRPHSS